MAEHDVAVSLAGTDGQSQVDTRSTTGKPAQAGLPAGIRWWETCGGWTARYALGTL